MTALRGSTGGASALLAAVALLGAAAPAADAAESFDGCTGTIASVPATISTAGVYCMKADLDAFIINGSLLTVAANNVTIDCNGYTLSSPATYGWLSYGIRSTGRNTRVRNCHVDGLTEAIYLAGGGGVVEDSTLTGMGGGGIRLVGKGYEVRRTRIAGNHLGERQFFGVHASAGSATVHRVDVDGVAWSSAACGVCAEGAVLMLHDSRVRTQSGVDGVRFSAGQGVVERNRLESSGGGTAVDCGDSVVALRGNHGTAFAEYGATCADGGDNVLLAPPAP